MVLGLFKETLRTGTCLWVMPKNSSFSCFMVIFLSYCPQFLGFSRICMSRKNPDMFERYDQKLAVLAFLAVFMSYDPLFRGSRRFTVTFRPDTCWKDMTINSSFSSFMAVFMSYCPLFRGSRAIYNVLPTWYMLERYEQKLVLFLFYGRFHELLPTV